MSDVSVPATVSFIINSVKERRFTDIISIVADKLGSFLCGTASHLTVTFRGASALLVSYGGGRPRNRSTGGIAYIFVSPERTYRHSQPITIETAPSIAPTARRECLGYSGNSLTWLGRAQRRHRFGEARVNARRQRRSRGGDLMKANEYCAQQARQLGPSGQDVA